MVGVYSVGGLCRMTRILNKISNVGWCVLLGVSLVGMALGVRNYSSPFCTLFAMGVFVLCGKFQVFEKIGRYLSWMVPSLFAVYLFHSRAVFGLKIMDDAESFMLNKGMNIFFVYGSVSVAVFIACLLLDMPRRFARGLIKMGLATLQRE